jgi:hypothetical protein
MTLLTNTRARPVGATHGAMTSAVRLHPYSCNTDSEARGGTAVPRGARGGVLHEPCHGLLGRERMALRLLVNLL